MTDRLDQYNVIWDSPSADVSGTMPVGNGEIGLNVWVEEGSGDVLMLIGKTDAWDENSINLKLGRVRLKFTPNPLVGSARFRQELRLRTGEIAIAMADLALRLWVDANHPVIRIELNGPRAFEVQATLEMWRTHQRTIKTQTGDIFKNLTGPDPFPTQISFDRVLSRDNRIIWCHHNEPREHDGYEVNMRLQGLGGMLDQMQHPLRGRAFGAAMLGEAFVAADPSTLRSTSSTRHQLAIYPLTLHPATIEEWQRKLDEAIRAVEAVPIDQARRDHEKWWNEFWNRSWIYVTSDVSDEQEAVFHITQGYILQRFMNACGGRGAQPIKFNGSIFSVGKPDDPDFRRWGGPGFWFQNQRLIYWPMLASGDFDLMWPWLKMYVEQLPLQRHRTRTYFKHGGGHYPETIMFWGAEVSAHYGWTPFEQRARPEAECSYLTYYWSGGIELTLILLEYFRHTSDEDFARSALLPVADAVTEFFDVHWPRDADGKIRFEPAQALETWHEATNPLPEIAGLQYTLKQLLTLPKTLTTQSMRDRWSRMLRELPPIPIGQKDGKRVILPAARFDRKRNTENPELYCIFPYKLFGVGKADLELARDTFAARLHPSHDCWSQDDVQMALLGLTEQVKDYLAKRASPASHSDSRFPGFWNAFHDWVPDMDHGGVLQLALQNMLMQCEDEQILLIPAWPNKWDADFKVHAPLLTIVEGKVRGGKLVDVRVTPEARRADVWTHRETGVSPMLEAGGD